MSEFTVLNPATEEPVRTVTQASAEETDAAIEAAAAAQVTWRDVAPGARARLLRSFAAAVDAHVEELAALEVAGSGHPIGQSRWEAGHVRDQQRAFRCRASKTDAFAGFDELARHRCSLDCFALSISPNANSSRQCAEAGARGLEKALTG